MNADRLEVLADHIEAIPPKRFNMNWWALRRSEEHNTVFFDEIPEIIDQSQECGTACCVAGWAIALWPEEAKAALKDTKARLNWMGRPDPMVAAGIVLGLTEGEAGDLFTGRPWRDDHPNSVNDPHLAAATLRQMAAAARAEAQKDAGWQGRQSHEP